LRRENWDLGFEARICAVKLERKRLESLPKTRNLLWQPWVGFSKLDYFVYVTLKGGATNTVSLK